MKGRYLGCVLIVLLLGGTALAQSVYTERMHDPEAVYLDDPAFGAKSDGKADATAAVQAAIDRVVDLHREGVVFVPPGRYLISRTVYVWAGVRLIGFGPQRPQIVLGNHTPGYDSGIAYMLFYAGERPEHSAGTTAGSPRYHRPPTPPGSVPPRTDVPDANPGTFYSGLSNIDFEIGAGNAGAVAVRFHAAQHSFLSHIDFNIGSGFAGVHEVGNEAEDLHFRGGQFGIIARKPSPAWQFTLVDSTFTGQRVASIRENEAGLTLVHDSFEDVPTAVSIDPEFSDQLWISHSSFRNISGPALMISNEQSRMTEINVEKAACEKVPVFAQLRETGRQFRAPGEQYEVTAFSHGLMLKDNTAAASAIGTVFTAGPVRAVHIDPHPAIAALPPQQEWVDVHSLGVRGDNHTDDTAALEHAIDTHRVLYFPSGRYILTDTVRLRPGTVLIGLHPSTTQFDLPDNTPAFQGPGSPKPLFLAPQGGNAQMRGLGIFTGGLNGRAVGLLWRSGADSLVDDVRFLGGHGTNGPDGRRLNPYNSTHSADPDPHRPWNAQYPSLWVDAGGGTFANIWTPDTFAQAGLLISNTEVPGHVYELSSEHHVQAEIKLDHVNHWDLYALQTEEESGESQFASSLEIDHSRDITVANYHGYRVTHSEQPFPYAVRVADSNQIRFRNVHVDSNSSIAVCDEQGECRQGVRPNKVPFANAIVDDSLHLQVRDREFATLDLSDGTSHTRPSTSSDVKQLATGFFNASGAAVDNAGRLYFVDAHFHRILRWDTAQGRAEVIRDAPTDPVNLVFDRAGDLIVVSSEGTQLTAYAFRPDQPQSPEAIFQPLSLQPAAEHPGMTVAMPVDYWFNGDFANTLSATQSYTYTSLRQMFEDGLGTRTTYDFVAPDHSLFVPTNLPIVQGEPFFGTKWVPVLYAYGLTKGTPGRPFYATNEAEQRTYRGTLRDDGSLGDLQPFVERGGESLAVDKHGNVYLAAGQIYVYSPEGALLRTIVCPERPHDIVFGGPDGNLLYVLSEHTLYAASIGTPHNDNHADPRPAAQARGN